VVALEAALCLFGGAFFTAAPFEVGASFGVVGYAGDDSYVVGVVELLVSAAVALVVGGVLRGGGDGTSL
jgi:hypothetical protein